MFAIKSLKLEHGKTHNEVKDCRDENHGGTFVALKELLLISLQNSSQIIRLYSTNFFYACIAHTKKEKKRKEISARFIYVEIETSYFLH